ncbi:MAG: hypothetical protein LBJ02_12025 [Bifidobacteriaceae bacterium]|jgi:hypothetical protein|nr:hypothetical protein [Bifidobacteriaceae bacterium]
MAFQITGAVVMCCCSVAYGLWQAGHSAGQSDSVVSRIGKLPRPLMLIPFVGILATYWFLSILAPKPLNAVVFALVPAVIAFLIGLAATRRGSSRAK